MDPGIYGPPESRWLDGGQHYQHNPQDYASPLDQAAKSKKSRGNLPREAVDYLMAWLYENRFRAYPCEETKKQMARHTGLTLQQVNNWYINARRRILPSLISKEGKEPRDYRITRKRTNNTTTTTATTTTLNNPTTATPSTPTIAPVTSIVSDTSSHPSSNLLTPPVTRYNSPTYSPISTDGEPFPSIASMFPASPSPVTQPGQQQLYVRSEYFPDSPSTNNTMSFVNESTRGAGVQPLTRSSRGVPPNDCLAQPQPELLSTLQNPSPYNYYNLVYNNDGEPGDTFPPVENLIRSSYGATDGNFRILEFNMI